MELFTNGQFNKQHYYRYKRSHELNEFLEMSIDKSSHVSSIRKALFRSFVTGCVDHDFQQRFSPALALMHPFISTSPSAEIESRDPKILISQ